MKTNDVFKLLLPGVIVGLLLGFGLGMIVGVNETDPIPNYIGWVLCCLIPTLLNCTVVLKLTAKNLKREISFINVLKRIIPYLFISIIMGIIVVLVIIEIVLGLDVCELSKVSNAIGQAITGMITSTILAYFALQKYVADVKYTRRTAKEK